MEKKALSKKSNKAYLFTNPFAPKQAKYFFTLFFVFFFAIIFAQKTIAQRILQNDSSIISIEKIDLLNSILRETNLSITPDGKNLFFMSNRGGQKWSQNYGLYKNQVRFDGDIWFSEKINNKWQAPKCLSQVINTANGEDEPNISQDGQSIFFQSWNSQWKQTGGPYYQADLNGNNWENVRGLGGGINDFLVRQFNEFQGFATDGMSVSPDQKWLLMAIAPKYEENMEIFIAQKDIKGTWGEPKICPISSKGDERSVFIAADGKTVFFASNGYGGFGGLDIFKTTRNEDGSFGEIINLGKPFNTEGDDYNFILTAEGNEAFFIREGDIYFAKLNENTEINPQPTILIDGKVTEGCKKTPVEAHISLINSQNEDVLANIRSNSLTGNFSLVTAANEGRFRLKITSKGREIKKIFQFEKSNVYRHYEFNFDFDCDENKLNDSTITPILMRKQPNFDLPKINFDFNLDIIDFDEQVKLDKLALNLLVSDKKIMISGHTDKQGSDHYNQDLALRRALQVKNYLILKGIKATRIQVKSFSFDKPIATNETEDGRANNRRVEFEFVN